jgi:hypothetical protein
MSPWEACLTVIALVLAALGTVGQALISLGEFRKLQKAMIQAQEPEFSRETHPSRGPKQPGPLMTYLLFKAPDPVRTAAWFTKSIRRFPRALARLKQSDEAKADLVKFTRQATGWAILMVGALCAVRSGGGPDQSGGRIRTTTTAVSLRGVDRRSPRACLVDLRVGLV